MVISFSEIFHSSAEFFYNSAIPVLAIIAGSFMVFGITLFWSLRILKIRNVTFFHCVSTGILSFLGTCILCAVLESIFFADLRFTLIDWVYAVVIFLVVHPVLIYCMTNRRFKIKRKIAIILSILTVALDFLIIVISVLICTNWIFSEPDPVVVSQFTPDYQNSHTLPIR